MYTLSIMICLASGFDVQCGRAASIHKTLNDCRASGAEFVKTLTNKSIIYVAMDCEKGGLA